MALTNIQPLANPDTWTGARSGARYKEYALSQKLGQTYTPGQAAGTAQAGYNKGATTTVDRPTLMPKPITDPNTPQMIDEAPAWSLEGDPLYQSALSAGQAQFNYARNSALADQQNVQTQKAGERKSLDRNATESRRRTAGNYAARGMAGGAAGALTLAEAQQNAEQIAARTSIEDQLAAVNQAYLQNYGATGTDWTGTLVGQQYKTQAAQQALSAQLAKYGV